MELDFEVKNFDLKNYAHACNDATYSAIMEL